MQKMVCGGQECEMWTHVLNLLHDSARCKPLDTWPWFNALATNRAQTEANHHRLERWPPSPYLASASPRLSIALSPYKTISETSIFYYRTSVYSIHFTHTCFVVNSSLAWREWFIRSFFFFSDSRDSRIAGGPRTTFTSSHSAATLVWLPGLHSM